MGDWLLTVPLLLIEILLVMKLDEKTFSEKAKTLGVGSALMIVSGYYGELVITGDLTPRWMCWFISMMFFLYIVYELLVGLSDATNSEADPTIRGKIQTAQVMTVISWCTYPVVYLFPMLGINAAHAVMGIQIGYCASDIISKCGVGLVIYQIICQVQQRETFGLIGIDSRTTVICSTYHHPATFLLEVESNPFAVQSESGFLVSVPYLMVV